MTRINEYYDLFDIKTSISNNAPLNELINNGALPTDIRATNETNPFRGFSNWNDFDTANPNNTTLIHNEHKAPQTVNTLSIDENGSIWCYPPANATVPYWDEIIFRNFDYQIQPHNIKADDASALAYQSLISSHYVTSYDTIPYTTSSNVYAPVPEYILDNQNPPQLTHLWGENQSTNANLPTIYKHDFSDVGAVPMRIYNYENTPLFLKFDQYPSRSKVIFSSCDKTRNPDITFKFGYEHGSIEPIKLTLSLSASNPLTDINNQTIRYNQQLTRNEIEKLLVKCYWCIEWVYNRKSGL